MKKVLLFLMMLVAICFTGTIYAQQTVTIGTGTSTTYYPIAGFYGWQYDVYIYTPSAAEDLEDDFDVSSIAYDITSSNSSTGATMTIWMKDVDEDFTLSSSQTFAQLTAGATQVYSNNSYAAANTGWDVYQLSQPFMHEGGKALMVAVLGTGCTTSGGCSRQCHYTSATGTHWYKHSDSSDPGTSATGSIDGYRANIQLEVRFSGSTCHATSTLTVESVDEQSAFLSWSPGGTETDWDIYLTTSPTDVPDSATTPTDATVDTFYNATSLNSSTVYYIYVRANCGMGEVSRWKKATFKTSQVPADLPYTCDFEDATQNSEWTIENGSQTNKWFIGSAVNNTPSGTNALYISNDNGVSNAYSNTTSYVYAFRDVDFTQGAAAYQIDFDWRNQGESASYDFLKVYVGDPVEVTAGSSMPAAAHAQLLGTFYGKNTWQHATLNLPSTASGVHRVYFYWYNDGSGGSNPPAAVDNLSISALTCGFPLSLNVDTITSSSITVHWHPATANDNAWEVAVAPYGTSADSVTFDSANDTIYTAQNLNSNTRYVLYVRTDCGGGDVSSVISTTFRTNCADFTDVPVVEDFEGYGSSSFPACWTKISSYSTYPYTSSSAAHGGSNYGLYFYMTTYNSGTYSYASAPAIDPSVNISDLSVKFFMKRSNSSVNATLGVMSDPTDTTTFTAIQNISLGTDWEDVEIPLNNVTATGRYIAIKCERDPNGSSTSGNIYLDDFSIYYTPACPRIVTVNVDENTILSDGATVTWTAGPSGSSWDVQVVLAGTNPSDNDWTTVNDTTYTAQGLNANTEYTVYVRTNCGSEVSDARSTNFRTACGTQTIPYFDDFESYTATSSSFPACWTSITGSSYTYSGSDSYGGAGKSLKIYGPGTVATPLIAHNVNELQISFQLNREGESSGPMVLGFTTDLTNLSNMITIATIAPTEYHTMKKYEYNLNNIGSTDQGYFVFQQQSTYSNWYYWLDNITIREIPSCLSPVVAVSSITTNSVTLKWNSDNAASAWNVVYGTGSFNPDTVTENLINVTDTFVTIDNLTSGQNYTFYVQTDCGSETSYFTDAITVTPGIVKISDMESLTACSGTLCDDGGLNGDYGNSRNDQIVLYPETPGSGIQVSGTLSSESGRDLLKIYDGVGTSGAVLYSGSGTGQTVPPVMSATALTVVFTTDGSVCYAGFNLTIECVDCVTPAPTLSQVGLDNANVTWSAMDGGSDNWEVAYGPAGFNINTVQPEYVSTNSYDILNLTNNTAYDFYVRALCGNGDTSAWSSPLHFTTLNALPAALPYFCDFEDTTIANAWTLVNGSCTNQWVIDTAANNTANGAYAMYISNDNGATNNYSHTASVVWAYRDFEFTGYGEYDITFDWRGQGEECCDYMKVYIGSPASVAAVDGSTVTPPAGAVELGEKLNYNASWNRKAYILDGTGINGVKRLYFVWRNDGSLGSSPAGAIDNIRIEGTNCTRPSNLTASNITTTTADLTWSPASETDQAWDIVYSTQAGFDPDAEVPVTVYDTTEALNNLIPSSVYYAYVRTNCGNNETSAWSSMVTFQTECETFDFPYSENFDSQLPSQMPLCWNSIGNYSTQPYVSTSYYISSPQALYMYAYGSTAFSMVASPELDPTVSLSTKMISLKMRSGSTSNMMIVGVLTDNTDASTFMPVDTLQCSATNTWEDHQVFLNNYSGAGHYIGFKLISPSGYSNYIDDIVIDDIPSCLPVSGITATTASATSVTLGWTEIGTATVWDIEYGAQGFMPGAGTQVAATTNPYTITGLTSGTVYDFYVRANCGGGDESNWVGPVSATPGSYNIPTSGEATVTMCGGVIYDDGGVNGNYSSSCDVTVVVNPDQAGLFVQLNGTYDIETGTSSRWDYLQIFDGNGNTGTVLFDSHLGDALTNITSTTGPLTLYFHSDASVTHSGFEIQVSCVSGTIPEPCNAPANVTVSNVTHNSVDVDWTQEGTPDSWTVSYKKGSVDTWTTAITNTHPYTITNLEPETSYTVFVTANCGDATSEPSAHVSFITGVGVANYELSNTAVYPNPTTGKFRIENSELRIENVEVYDVYGKMIMSVKVDDNHAELDLSNNASGVYFTRIFTDKGVATKRVVKK